MPRARSDAVAEVKAKLIARLDDGLHRPGQRFFSNRALAQSFGISYQTAHLLIAELEAEGWLERRAASGTYVAGRSNRLEGVELLFHPRGQRAASFGARLLEELRVQLEHAGIKARVKFVTDGKVRPAPRRFPVLWECPALASQLARQRHYVLILNDRPEPGLSASFTDSVSTDDFSGGAAAAEVLKMMGAPGRWAVFSGPTDDERSRQRVAGFASIAPQPRIISAGSWYFDKAIVVAPRLLTFAGVFCCNDRLAEAVISAAAAVERSPPAVVGFDDAPVSERLNFTTIAIPWRGIVEGAVKVIQRRLAGDSGPAAQLIFAPRPVRRGADMK